MKDRLIRFILNKPEPLYDLISECVAGKKQASILTHIRYFLVTGHALGKHAE